MQPPNQLLIAAALLIGALLVWQLAPILLLLFASIILATLIWTIAAPLERFTPLGHTPALGAAIVLLLMILAAVVWLFTVLLLPDLTKLISSLPERIKAAGELMGIHRLDEQVIRFTEALGEQSGMLSHVAGYTTGFFGVLASLLLVFAGGAYLALDMKRYQHGLVRLVPQQHRTRARDVMGKVGQALRLWLLGQLVAMLVVGFATGVSLSLLGVPSALALGVLAGLLEFIPFVGPLLAFGAALAIALSESLTVAAVVALLYLGIQQLEGSILVPLVQQRTVDLPAAVGLFGLVAFGILFGPLGILLGVPLTVVALVGVKQLYVQPIADKSTSGEDGG